MRDTTKTTDQVFDNHRQACANAIAACEAFIQMDINATPQEAIFVGYKAELVSRKADIRATQARANKAKRDAESFRDMMPTSEEVYN
jgi:hypothetical protein